MGKSTFIRNKLIGVLCLGVIQVALIAGTLLSLPAIDVTAIFLLALSAFSAISLMVLTITVLRSSSRGFRALNSWLSGARSGSALAARVGLADQNEYGHIAGLWDFFLDRLSGNMVQLRDVSGALEELTISIRESSDRLAGSTSSEAAVAEQLNAAAEQGLTVMGSIVAAVDAQQENIAEISHTIGELRANVQSTGAVHEAAERIGRELADRARVAIGHTDSLRKFLIAVGMSSQSVSELSGFIQDVTEKTNLLALNAAIEAARAGESGRGFAVLAQEISKLADTTAARTEEINKIVEEMRSSSVGAEQAAHTIQDGLAGISEGVTGIQRGLLESAEQGAAILAKSAVADVAVKDLLTRGSSIAASSQGQKTAMHEITTASSAISRNVETLSTASAALAAATNDVRDQASLLADLSRRFSLKGGDLMPWSEFFVLGVPEIDRQHKRLVDMINELYRAMAEGAGRESVGRLLDALLEYTVYHFGHEEKLFAAYRFPEAESHIVEHEELKKVALGFRAEFEAGSRTVGPRLMTALTNWLTQHIMVSDKKYVPLILKYGNRQWGMSAGNRKDTDA